MSRFKIIATTSVVTSILFLSGCWTTVKGEKIGTLVKIAKEGSIWGTWEAELIRGGINGGSGAWGKPFDFTIENTDYLHDLQKALDEQTPITVKYHKEAFCMPWRTETDCYFVDSFSYVKQK